MGFGFIPSRGHHHFLVSLSAGQGFISEHFTWDEALPGGS